MVRRKVIIREPMHVGAFPCPRGKVILFEKADLNPQPEFWEIKTTTPESKSALGEIGSTKNRRKGSWLSSVMAFQLSERGETPRAARRETNWH